MKTHLLIGFAGWLAPVIAAAGATAPARPNLLWISCEDTSPWFGFCGEPYARTPNLDSLAQSGVHYTNVFAPAPVCSPCRYAIITGTYATSYGTQRLRSQFAVPDTISGFPSHLRQAGYYCANNVKTDYNTRAEQRIIAESWNDSSAKAHWRNRRPGQPFFAVFNLMETHQGQIFESTPPKLDPVERHDPAKAPLPPYYPDTPTARATMARVHDCITAMDARVGKILAELQQEGLQDDTIVFFWPDHGQGIPRGKRTLWDSGLKVPLVIYFPPKYRHLAPSAPGGTCDRLVSLMDLGPTLLNLIGLPIPVHMQGRPFLGGAAAAPREYVFSARDRVDEVSELSRSIRDQRYLYVRNFLPDLSWNQPENFSDQLALRREIAHLAAAGRLNAVQLTYAGPRKPAEELYDTAQDPWQVKNLANDPAHRATLERLRRALRRWQVDTRDLGLLTEWQAAKLDADSGRPLVVAARAESLYPLERVLDTAWRVGLPGEEGEFLRRLGDPDSSVRYWSAVGLRVAGRPASGDRAALRKALADESIPVRIEAAGMLVAWEADRAALDLLTGMLASDDEHGVLHAARTLQLLGPQARPALSAVRAVLPRIRNQYATWSLTDAIAALAGADPAAPTPVR
jgi:arylsulfatase A-like enzyme